LPSVVLCTASNQYAVANSLREAGAAIVLGDADNIAGRDLIDALHRLMEDGKARDDMAHAAASLCDGLGARRLLAALDPPEAKDGAAVHLRPAVAADAERLLGWQRDPRTRRYFRVPRVPSAREHHTWFTDRLNNPQCLFHIVMHNGECAGVLRLEWCAENGSYEVSIFVAPERWRLGIGSVALSLARNLLPQAEFQAEVREGNEASHALFAAAGYHQVESNPEVSRYVSQPGADTAPSLIPKEAVQ